MNRSPSKFRLPARKQESPKKTLHRHLGGHVCFLLSWALLLLPLFAAAEEPTLVPQPREVRTVGRAFRTLPNLRIALAADSKEDRFAATSLQEESRLVTGRTFPIVSWTEGGAATIVLGRIENPMIGSSLLRHHVETPEIGSEGYVLDVDECLALLEIGQGLEDPEFAAEWKQMLKESDDLGDGFGVDQ